MPAFMIFPALTYSLLLIVFVRAFSRSTGLSARFGSTAFYTLLGGTATLLTFFLLVLIDNQFKSEQGHPGFFLSPFLEELVKFAVLYLLVNRILIAGEPLQKFRQTVLAATITGLAFGLVETYLYLFTNITLLTSSMLMGSIPLHMATGGFLGYTLTKTSRPGLSALLLSLIILFHLGYNQIVQLPPPMSYLSFLMLLIAAIILLNLLTAPRDIQHDD